MVITITNIVKTSSSYRLFFFSFSYFRSSSLLQLPSNQPMILCCEVVLECNPGGSVEPKTISVPLEDSNNSEYNVSALKFANVCKQANLEDGLTISS